MSAIHRIKQPISTELKQFDIYFRQIMKTKVPFLNLVIRYLLRRKGKQIRPILVFLTAKLFGKPNESTYTAAALIEILHTAALIHNDVVDESNERHGFFSIHAIWKSKVAILIGDYLLAKGLILAVNNKEYDILNRMADAVKEMSEGVLLEKRNSRKFDITENDYFLIVRKKTSALISCCCYCGVKSVVMPDDTAKNMQYFGELLGIAFHIKTDLLDYQANSFTGISSRKAMLENKFTLPLIHAFEMSTLNEKKRVQKLFNNSAKSTKMIHEVLEFITKNQGITYAEEKMNAYAAMALNELSQFPNIEIRASMREFIDYTIHRIK